jgi:hypothetical protein
MARVNAAGDAATRLRVVKAWAAAAGGAVSGAAVVLPPLPDDAAVGWLKGAAGMVGLEVRERAG